MMTSAVETSIQETSPLFGTGADAAAEAAEAASAAAGAAGGGRAPARGAEWARGAAADAADAAASSAIAAEPKPSSRQNPNARIVNSFFMVGCLLLSWRRRLKGVLAGLAG